VFGVETSSSVGAASQWENGPQLLRTVRGPNFPAWNGPSSGFTPKQNNVCGTLNKTQINTAHEETPD
jgi:hypothetical protein